MRCIIYTTSMFHNANSKSECMLTTEKALPSNGSSFESIFHCLLLTRELLDGLFLEREGFVQ